MEMETSTEPMDPLTPGVAALAVPPEGGCREPGHSLRAAVPRLVRPRRSLQREGCLDPSCKFIEPDLDSRGSWLRSSEEPGA